MVTSDVVMYCTKSKCPNTNNMVYRFFGGNYIIILYSKLAQSRDVNAFGWSIFTQASIGDMCIEATIKNVTSSISSTAKS